MPVNKYHAKQAVSDGIHFASKYEAQVYRVLNHLIKQNDPKGIIYRLDTQVPVTLYDGLLMPARTWKCDFAITDLRTSKTLLIEAKGMIAREFSYMMNLLASNNQRAFSSLIVVSENKSFDSEFWGTLAVKTSGEFHTYINIKLQRGINGNFSL
jgi:Protein of unknown function (DUF1064)